MGPTNMPGITNRPSSTLITVAPTGAESEKSAVPGLPVTLEELVTTAKECREAGAAVIHVHIRDDAAQPTLDLGRLTDTVQALRGATDLIVQLSTGGAVTDSFERRLAVLDARPDACSLTCGTVNFGADVFMNPWGFMTELYAKTQALGVVPEFELFDFGHIAALHRLLAELGEPCRRTRALRLGDGRAWWHARQCGHARRGGGGTAAWRDLVCDRHRPDRPSSLVRGARSRRPSACWHGGHRYLRQGPGGSKQCGAGRAGGRGGRAGGAAADEPRRGARHARSTRSPRLTRCWPRWSGRGLLNHVTVARLR